MQEWSLVRQYYIIKTMTGCPHLGLVLGHNPQTPSRSVIYQTVLVLRCEGPEEGDALLLTPLSRSEDTKLHVLLCDVTTEATVRDEGGAHRGRTLEEARPARTWSYTFLLQDLVYGYLGMRGWDWLEVR